MVVWAVVLPLLRTVISVAPVLVVAVGFFSILHVGVLVDDRHHLRDHLGVALKHLAPELVVVQPLVEVVDNVPIISLHNRVAVSEVPFVVVMKGLIGLVGDAAQFPSGFGTRTGRLEVVDEGSAEVLPAIDGAGVKSVEPV
jgi:hypothetical protein